MFEKVSIQELEDIVETFPRGKAVKVIYMTYLNAEDKISLQTASFIYDKIKQGLKDSE